MITEAMVMKGFAYIGAYTVSTKVVGPLLVPVVGAAGNLLGHGLGKVMNLVNGKGKKSHKEKVEEEQAKVEAVKALLAKCDEALAENNEAVIEPEPKFDQQTQNWILKVREQYGGFTQVVLE